MTFHHLNSNNEKDKKLLFAALDHLMNMELVAIGEQVFAVESITKKRVRKVRTLLVRTKNALRSVALMQ